MKQWSLARSEKIPRLPRGRPQGGERMKRITLLFLTLIFALSAVSCKIVPEKNNETATSSTTEPIQIEHPGVDIFDYGEYLKFMEDDNYTIPYERLKFLGEFGGFHWNRDGYSYEIIVNRALSQYYHLSISTGNVDYSNIICQEPPTEDLRTFLGNTENQLIVHYLIDNEIFYSYEGEQLVDVRWSSGGHRFWLSNYNNGLSWYPDDGSLVSRLLNKNTALEAKAEFVAMVFGEE